MMSHVVKLKVEIKDLSALKVAAKELGLEFVEGADGWRWWGYSVGDYKLPENFSEANLKNDCLHVLRVPGNTGAYDVGIFKSKTHPGYELLWDFYGTAGKALEAKIGKDGKKLIQEYSTAVAMSIYRKQGFRVSKTVKDDKVVLTFTGSSKR